jgi:hypothetical protein
MKPPPNKLPATERLLFACLVAWLGIGGFLYELFRNRLPAWQLIGAILAFFAFGYVAYRAMLGALRR